jgi:predicted Zn-dependent peptidase
MAGNEIQVYPLENNIVLTYEKMPLIPSVALGVFFKQGSRNEPQSLSGITNLLLGVLFRGSVKKSSSEIKDYIERHGAIIEPITTKELSGLYARFLPDKFSSICEIVEEILLMPAFLEEEILKEQELIEKEIIAEDDENEKILFKAFYKTLFSKDSLGMPVLGEITTVKKITKADLTNYYQDYLKQAIVISVAGDLSNDVVVKQTARLASAINKHRNFNDKKGSKSQSLQPSLSLPISVTKNLIKKDLFQSYTVLGTFRPDYSYRSSNYYQLNLLNTILGGCISSRLYSKIREERGLVYSISSFIDFYYDLGVFGIFFVASPKEHEEILTVIKNEITALKEKGASPEELNLAVNYTKSRITIANNEPLARVIRNAKNLLFLERVLPIEQILDSLEKTTTKEVNDCAQNLPLEYSIINLIPKED